MNKPMKYVGIDVHKATLVIAVMLADGLVISRSVIATSAQAVIDFFEGVKGRVWVTFEEGALSQWLHDLLVPRVERVVVCNARHNHLLSARSRDDQTDAEGLAELLRLGAVKPTYHQIDSVRKLRELVRSYESIVGDSTRVMTRLKTLFRARGIPCVGESVYNYKKKEQWLEQLSEEGARMRAAVLYTEMEMLMTLRRQARRAMVTEARRHHAYRLLRKIPFFGPVRIATFLAIVITPFRFRTKRQLWAYAGLAVVTRTSADHDLLDGMLVRRGRRPLSRGLNVNHNHALKNVLIGAAHAASFQNGPFNKIYRQIVARGVKPEMAKLTLARKLASIALRLWKKGEQFDPAKLTIA